MLKISKKMKRTLLHHITFLILTRIMPLKGLLPLVSFLLLKCLQLSIPTIEVGSDISVMEGTFAQDPNDDAPLEDMADVHDSYDAVLANVQDQDAPAEIPKLKVTSPTTKDASPTKTDKLISR